MSVSVSVSVSGSTSYTMYRALVDSSATISLVHKSVVSSLCSRIRDYWLPWLMAKQCCRVLVMFCLSCTVASVYITVFNSGRSFI